LPYARPTQTPGENSYVYKYQNGDREKAEILVVVVTWGAILFSQFYHLSYSSASHSERGNLGVE
jgi:hypothetical protein